MYSDRVLRWVRDADAVPVDEFVGTDWARDLASSGKLVHTRKLALAECEAALAALGPGAAACHKGVWYEHEKVAFPSYPHEWPPEMLYAAGELTLDLALGAVKHGFGLKDATPGNVLFSGPRPVFIDVPSFERRDAHDPVWRPHAQFARTFLLPLLVNRRLGTPLADIFLNRRDGLEPEEVYRSMSFGQRLVPQVLGLVSMPVWLSGRARAQEGTLYGSHKVNDPEKARFILESILGRLKRTLRALQPARNTDSTWADYTETHGYSEAAMAAKEKFVRDALIEAQSERVLDVGANTGKFSMLAARQGASVIAIDLDPVCVGAIWRQASDAQLDVLPLAVNLARPPGGVGWANRECPSFLDRAQGAFDAVIMLAVLHHLLVTERVPLAEILSLAAKLTRKTAVIEFVGPEDPMFRRIARGRDDLHAGLTPETFAAACAVEFEVVRSVRLPEMARWIYLLRKRSS